MVRKSLLVRCGDVSEPFRGKTVEESNLPDADAIEDVRLR